MFSYISFDVVLNHFNERVSTHNKLCELLEANNTEEFVSIAVGFDDLYRNGNYSASEHSLGEKILASNDNVYNRIFAFAQEIYESEKRVNIPKKINGLGLSYLKISIGSEIATMLKPDIYWVANIRTLWTQAYLRNNFSINNANATISEIQKQLSEQDIRRDYNLWAGLYPTLEDSLREVSRIGNGIVGNLAPSNNIFLWADAICSELFEKRSK